MENRETLTAELKGAGGKGGRVTSEMKDQLWQEITNSINRYMYLLLGKLSTLIFI